MAEKNFVIVGGGLAAATAAETLRSEGFDGHIRIIASENHHPYLRPPLSKEYLKRDAGLDSVYIHNDQWYADNNVEVTLGTQAQSLDTAAHEVTLEDGKTVKYDRLLLATGASSRHLQLDGANAEGILYLRTLDESEKLHDAIAGGGKRIVIVGAGWIGLEVASAARGYGNEVTVIAPESVPLIAVVGEQLGSVFEALHTENGVNLQLSTGVSSFATENGRVTAVVTDKGETVGADVVIVGIGAIPAAELATEAQLTVKNGIQTDAHLRTSAEDVFAAGDVANSFHPIIEEHIRNEHWANAVNSGKTVAKSMLGQDVVFDEIPYFFTDQFDLGMEYAGYPTLTSDAEVVVRGDLDSREFVAFWRQPSGRIVAGMNVNIWDVSDDIQALIRSQKPVAADRLADEGVPIAEL